MSEQTRTQVRGNGHASMDDLEQEMAATRAEMNETLAALARRLSPESLFHQAMERFGGPGEFAGNLTEAVKGNPIPAALTGIGIGWMMMAQRQGWESRPPPQAHHGPGVTEQMKHGGAEAVRRGEEKLAHVGHEGSETARSMRDAAEEYRARTQAQIAKATESARDFSNRARTRGSEAGRRAGDFFNEQPLVVGALAIGIGALLGAALQKRSEPAELTHGREALTRRAREGASEVIARGGEVARAGGRAVTEKAEDVASGESSSLSGRSGGDQPGGGHGS